MVQTPLLLVNLKTYAEGIGPRAIEIAQQIQEAGEEKGVAVAVAAGAYDLGALVNGTSIPIFAQHIDAIGPGSSTGHILPEAIKFTGAVGTLLNHSERSLSSDELGPHFEAARRAGLDICACARDIPNSVECARLGPDLVAVEPPELIGGEISVSEAKPEIISGTVDAVHEINDKIPVLCGAGIKNAKDVSRSLELGAGGVLVASGVIKRESPKDAVIDLLNGF